MYIYIYIHIFIHIHIVFVPPNSISKQTTATAFRRQATTSRRQVRKSFLTTTVFFLQLQFSFYNYSFLLQNIYSCLLQLQLLRSVFKICEGCSDVPCEGRHSRGPAVQPEQQQALPGVARSRHRHPRWEQRQRSGARRPHEGVRQMPLRHWWKGERLRLPPRGALAHLREAWLPRGDSRVARRGEEEEDSQVHPVSGHAAEGRVAVHGAGCDHAVFEVPVRPQEDGQNRHRSQAPGEVCLGTAGSRVGREGQASPDYPGDFQSPGQDEGRCRSSVYGCQTKEEFMEMEESLAIVVTTLCLHVLYDPVWLGLLNAVELHQLGLLDPDGMRIKREIHAVKKADKGRWRLIWLGSVRSEIVDCVLHTAHNQLSNLFLLPRPWQFEIRDTTDK